jgi:radical SAM superfamily enzyme YgiQ (UPF0313 family)
LFRLGQSACIFGDDDATGKDAYVLFEELSKRKGKIATPLSVTTRVDAVDPELLRLMASVGVGEVCLGIESGSQKMIDHMHKDITVDAAKSATKMIKDSGMRAIALMINNGIGETPQDKELTRTFLEEIKPDGVGGVGALWLYPSTKYYNEVREGKYDNEIKSGKSLVGDEFFLNPQYSQCVIAWKDGEIFAARVTDDEF